MVRREKGVKIPDWIDKNEKIFFRWRNYRGVTMKRVGVESVDNIISS